jgi:iron(II)-dependent oxidoreductase
MVLVAAGAFEMGGDADVALAECQQLLEPDLCDRNRHVVSEPIHSVYLDDFYMDKYEISNAQYAYFLNEQGNQTEAGAAWLNVDSDEVLILESSGSWQPKDGYSNHPVVQVTWYGARAYCQWRGARLPTEGEWEKAARGRDGRFYPWGNSFDGGRLNFCDSSCTLDWAYPGSDDGYARTAPVGAYSEGVSPYGVYSMAGNVSEWVEDWFEVYPGGDPASSEYFGGDYRVIRGGSWSSTGAVGTTHRIAAEPAQAPFSTGFRCARSP